jgi:hypothetical protein
MAGSSHSEPDPTTRARNHSVEPDLLGSRPCPANSVSRSRSRHRSSFDTAKLSRRRGRLYRRRAARHARSRARAAGKPPLDLVCGLRLAATEGAVNPQEHAQTLRDRGWHVACIRGPHGHSVIAVTMNIYTHVRLGLLGRDSNPNLLSDPDARYTDLAWDSTPTAASTADRRGHGQTAQRRRRRPGRPRTSEAGTYALTRRTRKSGVAGVDIRCRTG